MAFCLQHAIFQVYVKKFIIDKMFLDQYITFFVPIPEYKSDKILYKKL